MTDHPTDPTADDIDAWIATLALPGSVEHAIVEWCELVDERAADATRYRPARTYA